MAFYPYATIDGASFHVTTGVAGAAISTGDLLHTDGAGKLTPVTGDPVAVTDELFVAAHSASTNDKVKVYRTGPTMIFRNVAAGALQDGEEYEINSTNMQVTTTNGTIDTNPVAEVYKTLDSANNEYAVIIKRAT